MLRHFILAIFLFTLALPAMGMALPKAEGAVEDCHGLPAPNDESDHHNDDARLHGCIGCIAHFGSADPLAEEQPAGFMPFTTPIRRLSGTTPRPSLPPPRG